MCAGLFIPYISSISFIISGSNPCAPRYLDSKFEESVELVEFKFSPSGEVIAAFDSNNFAILDIYNFSVRSIFDQQISYFDSEIEFSPDGSLLAISKDNEIILWHVETSEKVKVLSYGDDRIKNIAFSPNGSMLLAITEGKITSFEVESGETISTHSLSDGRNLSFFPDGRLITSGEKTRVWDITEGNFSLLNEFDGGNAKISPDQSIIYTSGKLWDVQTGEQLFAFPSSHEYWAGVVDQFFSPDGKLFFVVYEKGVVNIWGVEEK